MRDIDKMPWIWISVILIVIFLSLLLLFLLWNRPHSQSSNSIKAIALLDLTTLTDQTAANTFRVISPDVPIIDTQGSFLTSLLDEYYRKGSRIFIGFSSSNVLQEVLPWFENHPDTRGISLYSTSDSLSVPKNVLRLLPPEKNTIRFTIDSLKNLNKPVVVVYEEGNIAAEQFAQSLKNAGYNNQHAINLGTEDGAEKLNEIFSSSSESVIVPYFSRYENKYKELLLTTPARGFIIFHPSTSSPLHNDLPDYFANRYYNLSFYSSSTSTLHELNRKWNQDHTPINLSVEAFDAVLVGERLIKSLDSPLPFDVDMNSDRVADRYVLLVWDGSKWNVKQVLGSDPLLGEYAATINKQYSV